MTNTLREQRVEAKVRYDDHARFDWQFVPRPKRKGLPLSEMDIRQKRLAIDVLKLAYSAAGFEKIEKIRDQQNYLHEKQNQDPPHCCGNYGNACGNPDSTECPDNLQPRLRLLHIIQSTSGYGQLGTLDRRTPHVDQPRLPQ